MILDFVVVIPARYASSRLPGKALLTIQGKTMLQHVFERATESGAGEIIIATDDTRIADASEQFGATVCMTGDHHQSGTERIAEVADLLDWGDDKIVVNLQGDEPTMPAAILAECALLLNDTQVDIATLASPFLSSEDFENPNCVKVVTDHRHRAIYFSRAPIPYQRASDAVSAKDLALHHHGIYAYRCGVLRKLVSTAMSELELCEQLEQLRALSAGMTIAVGVPTVRPGIGVDTREDLQRTVDELQRMTDD